MSGPGGKLCAAASPEHLQALHCPVPDSNVSILVVQQLHGTLGIQLLPVLQKHIHLCVCVCVCVSKAALQ